MKAMNSRNELKTMCFENAAEFWKLIASEVKDPRHIPLKRDWRLVQKTMNHTTGSKTFFLGSRGILYVLLICNICSVFLFLYL